MVGEELYEYRMRVVRDAIANGIGLKDTAEKLRVSSAGLFQYLDSKGHVDLRKQLGAVTRVGVSLDSDEFRRRHEAFKNAGTIAAAARALGMKAPSLGKWLKENPLVKEEA